MHSEAGYSTNMVTVKEIKSLLARLGLFVVDNDLDDTDTQWTISSSNLEGLVYKTNRALDSLECVSIQASRWLQEREKLKDDVEALEQQNVRLAKAYVKLLADK